MPGKSDASTDAEHKDKSKKRVASLWEKVEVLENVGRQTCTGASHIIVV
jgi:hypothetical protein